MAEKKTATKAVKKAPAKKVAKKAAAPTKKVATKTISAKTKTIIKSAKTGDIVSKEFAKKNPDTTMAITVPVNKTPHVNETAQKRTKAAKAAKKSTTPAKKAAAPAKKAAAKKAVKKVTGEKRDWRRGENKPTQAFGQTFGSIESAAAAAHVPLETMQARVASKDAEFAHVKYGSGRRKK